MKWRFMILKYLLLLIAGYSSSEGSENIAKDKTATQSTNHSRTYQAPKAVNGDYSDFTHTEAGTATGWWKVNLEAEYIISRIELYNRKGSNGILYKRLAKITILTSTVLSPGYPSPGSAHWTNRSYHEAPYGPVGIIQFSSPIFARYVAVYSTNARQPLSLAEVEIYESVSLTKPMNVQLQSNPSGCVTVTWEEPELSGATVNRYEYKCTNYNWKVADINAFTATACGYTDTNVTCSVSAVVAGGASQEETATLYTGSNNVAYRKSASQKNQLSSYSADKATNGILDGSFEFTHTNPGTNNWWMVELGQAYNIARVELYNRPGLCGEVLCYGRLAEITILTNARIYPVYPHPDTNEWTAQSYHEAPYGPVGIIQFRSLIFARNVVVSSANSGVPLSLVEVEVYTSMFLTRVLNLQLTSDSTDCITLSWQEPENTGGRVIRYEYKCTNNDWTPVKNDTNALLVTLDTYHVTSCEYEPYTYVTCSVSAVVRGGASQEESNSAYTACDEPDAPAIQPVNKSRVNNENRTRWKYTVQWTPPSRKNCDGTLTYQYGINDRLNPAEISDTSATFYLDGYQLYNFTLVARNSHGDSNTVFRAGRSNKIPPQFIPADVQLTSNSTDCVTWRWKPPHFPGGSIRQYQYICNGSNAWSTVDSTTVSEYTHRSCEYEPYTQVMCGVKARNGAGYGNPAMVTVYTLCGEPASPEYKVLSFPEHGNRSGGVGISVYINMTKPFCQRITEYRITITRKDGQYPSRSYTTQSFGNFTYANFTAYTSYDIIITAANNEKKTSQHSGTFKTVETAPHTASSISFLESNTSCVTFAATKPSVPNGYIHSYVFNCTDSKITRSNTIIALEESGESTICGFSSATKVTCTAMAINKGGSSPPNRTAGYTQLKVRDVTNSKPVVQSRQEGSNTVSVEIKKLKPENVNISTYLVMMNPLTDLVKRSVNGRCDQRFAQNPQDYASSTANGCYATAELTVGQVGNGTIFNVGDDNMYGPYRNVPLKSKAGYELYLAITVDVEEGAKPLVIVLDPVKISGTTSPPTKMKIGSIIGYVVGGIAIIAIVAIGVLFLRRRKKAVDEKPQEISKLTPVPPCPQVALLDHDTSTDDQYENVALLLRQGGRISIGELEIYIKNNASSIDQQYGSLKNLPKPIMTTALLPINSGKCRYKGLYPSDEHRVILQRDGEDNDFINASYIAGYSKDKAYIAAQGPTPAIVNDFWYMIWQERPSAIVMLTRAIENGKNKCEQYWPIEKQEVLKFDDISVTCAFTESFADFTVTHLTVSKGGQSRSILHFNYLSWPDHGVPDDLGSYVVFYTKIVSMISRSTRPLLVHCSAGVGRTGTYIALEYLLEQAKKEKAVDLLECVRLMRERRPCMVQTVDQYQFLHHILYEALATRGFSCSSTELNAKIKAHERQRTGSNRIREEYQHIQKRMQLLDFDYTIAEKSDHLRKNRFPDILPCDKYMPHLAGAQRKYINAVYADGYGEKDTWIATQLPLSNTICDFWQLVIEQDINIIVQLDSTEMPFYPMKDMASLSTSLHSLVRGNSEDNDLMQTIPLQVQSDKVEQSVYILVLTNWCNASGIFPPIGVIVSLCGAIEELQKRIGNKKICVTCLDGSSKSGMYICASNAIEKLKSEQEVDLYHPVMMSKIRRPQFISSIEQYTFLYKVLSDYTDSFSEYANFK